MATVIHIIMHLRIIHGITKNKILNEIIRTNSFWAMVVRINFMHPADMYNL